MHLRAVVVVLLVAGLWSLPVAASTIAGSLDVEGAKGVISVRGSGGLLGHVAQGSVALVDLSPSDSWHWWLDGREVTRRAAAKGAGVSFRILGGDYLVVVRGKGISISAHGSGTAYLLGVASPAGPSGLYTTDANADCQDNPSGCSPLPSTRTRVRFGTITPPSTGQASG